MRFRTKSRGRRSRPSLLFNLRDAWKDFLESARSANADMPSAPEQLEKTGGVRLILADRNDPDGVAFVGGVVASH